MALISISEAAKLAGIARSHFYSQYLNSGFISVTRDEKGKPKIDTSELVRVFGVLTAVQRTPEKTVHQDSAESASNPSKNEATQTAMIELLKEQLAEAKEREKFYQQQLTELSQTIKLLEHKPTSEPCKWWQVWK
ncbi:MAG: hypothetical protein E6Q83_20095 [Thiothrix sp.]|nr:MAG: hypothetical protein E6Q83_20095 [Thiothrix sp.]